jgi:SAM-dependent methyltransferase
MKLFKTQEESNKYWGIDFKMKTAKHLTAEQKELAKYCEKGRGLDIGCGGIKCHPNCIGVDLHPDSIAELKVDCQDLAMFKDNELDFIVSSHLLEHLPDPIESLTEWKRVLRPGGVLAIAVPDGQKRPRYLLRNGHKSNIGLETLRLMLHNILDMKLVEVKNVPKINPNKFVALVAARKR